MGYLVPCFRRKAMSLRESPRSFKIKYLVRLVSLFAPGTIKDFRLLMQSSLSDSNPSKILVKQSYILLVWFYYLTSANGDGCNDGDTANVPGFFIFPRKVTKFTLIKAPMAHKTFSQEQFEFSTYKFSLSLSVPSGKNCLNSKGSMPQVLIYLKGLNLFYGTNLLFLKNFITVVHIVDTKYFSCNHFFNLTHLK